MNKKTIRDIDLTGKRVLVRVDFNVPLEGGKVTDDTRIRAALPTLKYILDQKPRYRRPDVAPGAAQGRPGSRSTRCARWRRCWPSCSARQWRSPRTASARCAEEAAAALPQGGVLLLENTRFHPTEEKNDLDLAKQLAELGDVYVNDAFGSAHRAHSSTEGVAALPARRGRAADGKGTRLSGERARNPGAPVRRHPGRREGLGQDRRDRSRCSARWTSC